MRQYTGYIILLAILIPTLLYAQRKYDQTGRKINVDQNHYQRLRNQALRMTPELLQLDTSLSRSPFGILMEFGVNGGTASLVAFVDGNASMYLSSGAAVIGGFAHEAVQKAAHRFVDSASTYLARMKLVSDYPPPTAGNVTFYALTDQGVLTITATEKELREKLIDIWSLYYLAHDVITQLRKLAADLK